MGKTKTAVIGGAADEELSGKAAYEAKKKAQEAKQKELNKKGKGAVSGVGLKGGERIKVIGGDEPLPDATSEKSEQTVSRWRKTRIRSGKYKDARKKIDRQKLYDLMDAIKLVKETSYSKFDGSVELHLSIKKDKFSENVELSYSTGATKVIEVADDKTIKKLEKGKVDFDLLLATKEMMPKLVPFAKILGPKGLMPNPKNGTLIKDAKEAKKFSGNSVQVKTEKKAPIIHVVVGKVKQPEKELKENIEAVIEKVGPKQVVKASLCATMGPGIKLKVQ